MSNDTDYTCDSIEVLSGLECIRSRPGLYLGDLQPRAMKSRLAIQLAQFAVLARRRARIRLEDDGAVIIDDDIGMPIEQRRDQWLPEHQLTIISCGPPATDDTPPEARYFQWSALTIAMSTFADVEIHSGGLIYRQRFEYGHALAPDVRQGPDHATRARYRLQLDPQMFGDASIDADDLKNALEDLLFLAPALDLELYARGKRADLSRGRAELARLSAKQRDLVDRVLALQAAKNCFFDRCSWRNFLSCVREDRLEDCDLDQLADRWEKRGIKNWQTRLSFIEYVTRRAQRSR